MIKCPGYVKLSFVCKECRLHKISHAMDLEANKPGLEACRLTIMKLITTMKKKNIMKKNTKEYECCSYISMP